MSRGEYCTLKDFIIKLSARMTLLYSLVEKSENARLR
jgi:hypothetical protein